jgi:hypothetical protein
MHLSKIGGKSGKISEPKENCLLKVNPDLALLNSQPGMAGWRTFSSIDPWNRPAESRLFHSFQAAEKLNESWTRIQVKEL